MATLLCAALLLPAAAAGSGASGWQGILTLRTRFEGPPDVNPPFDILVSERFFYPYTLRVNFTDQQVDREWRALYLENEYVKCAILPDLGGHLHSCLDKLSGREMFYANLSVKKRWIGPRGAWVAMGIELNFPVAHNWVSVSPVDFAVTQEAGGSASAWVGLVDRVYGMQWLVEFLLAAGQRCAGAKSDAI